jgi:acyl carrier protein
MSMAAAKAATNLHTLLPAHPCPGHSCPYVHLNPTLWRFEVLFVYRSKSEVEFVGREDIRRGLAAILAEVADVPQEDVTDDKFFTTDLRVDSLGMVELVLVAEKEFGVQLSEELMRDVKTVGQAIDAVEKALVCNRIG